MSSTAIFRNPRPARQQGAHLSHHMQRLERLLSNAPDENSQRKTAISASQYFDNLLQ
jgi:hypothetical protein